MNISYKFSRKALGFLLFSVVVALCSCQNKDYVNAIPSTATALVRIDPKSIDADNLPSFVKEMAGADKAGQSGIDFSSALYAFETVDGNFGFCAKVDDHDQLTSYFESLSAPGKCGKIAEAAGNHFTSYADSWCIGYSSSCMVAIGPVTAASLPDMRRTIARLLSQDEERSIVSRPLFARIDTMSSPVSLVAEARALPEKLVAPLMLGAPKDADPSQVLVAASVSFSASTLRFDAETFSANSSVDKALKQSAQLFRPVGATYVGSLSKADLFGLFLNVDGKTFLPLLQNNKSLQALLVGMNTAIDFDNIIRSVDGDLVFKSGGIGSGMTSLSMQAKVCQNPSWLADVSYWKSSCQPGCSITDAGANSWVYSSGNDKMRFGLANGAFYAYSLSGSTAGTQAAPLLDSRAGSIEGSRMAIVVNPSALSAATGTTPAGALGSVLASLKTIVFVLK